MRSIVFATILALAIPTAVCAQTAAAPAAPAARAATAPSPADIGAAAAMTTGATTIGDMLDNAAAKAVLLKHLPEVVSSDQIDMARSMTLKDIQSYAAEAVTDSKLLAIDHDLAALKK